MPFNPYLLSQGTGLSFPSLSTMMFSENAGDLGSGWGKGKKQKTALWSQCGCFFFSDLKPLLEEVGLDGIKVTFGCRFIVGSQTNSATYGYWIHLHTPSALMGSFPRNSWYLLLFFLSLSKHAFPKTSGSSTFGASSLFLQSTALFYVTVCPTSMLT